MTVAPMKPESDDVHTDHRTVPAVQASRSSLAIGDLVKWKFELPKDPQFGALYVVVGFNNELPSIAITRASGSPGSIHEFHISQLERVS